MRRPFLALTALLSAAACLAGCAQATAPAPATPASDAAVVRTDAGPVRGTVSAGHRTFQGIPYAAPPTGQLRWAPPRRPEPWRQAKDATRPGPLCAQDGLELGAPSNAENCLSLNVTTPRGAGGRLPVLVWVHGGSFKDGGGKFYGAARMARLGRTVVVTVNYRLGALGFLTHPALGGADAGNFGLRDQQAALSWVRRNAAAFGGDPGNVTLAGESGGGTAVCAHLSAPGSRDLFHRAIVQSADCGSTWSPEKATAPRSRAVAERQGRAVAAKLGCTEVGTAADCLRGKTVRQVRDASGDGAGVGPVFGTPTLPIDPARALATGRMHRVPVLHGINRDEETFRVYGTELESGPTTVAGYRAEVRRMFGADADAVLAEYPCATNSCAASTLSALLTDANYAHPAAENAARFAERVPTFGYEFADRDAPWFRGLPPARFDQGAYHTSELPSLFDASWAEPLTAAQQRLAETMIRYWTRFARTGSPNGAGAPHWSPFTGPGSVQSLAPGEVGRTTDFAAAHHLPFWSTIDR